MRWQNGLASRVYVMARWVCHLGYVLMGWQLSWVCLSFCVLMAKLLFPLCLCLYGLTRCGFPQDVCSYVNARLKNKSSWLYVGMEWQGGVFPRLVFLQDSKMSVSSMVWVVMRWQDGFASNDGWNDKTGLYQGECCYEMARWICLKWWMEW